MSRDPELLVTGHQGSGHYWAKILNSILEYWGLLMILDSTPHHQTLVLTFVLHIEIQKYIVGL